MGGAEAVISLMSSIFPEGGIRVYHEIAPKRTPTPFSVYRIQAHREDWRLGGVTSDDEYSVQVDTAADSATEAVRECAKIAAALGGAQRTADGLSVRVDFESERALGRHRSNTTKELVFTRSQDFTFWVGY